MLETPVHVVDWLPTIVGLVGARPERERAWDGVDLGPLLFHGEPLAERELYWTWSRRTNRWALRRGDWKLVRYGREEPRAPGDWQLFDLATDPGERRDLAAERPEVLAALHARFEVQRALDRREPPR